MGFDSGELAALVERLNFSRGIREAGLEGAALAEAQRRNLAALQAISQSMSARYQHDFRTALEGLREALAAADGSPDMQGQNALAGMEALGQEATRARDEALEAVATEVAAVLEAMKKE